MIFVYHNNIKIVAVANCSGEPLPYATSCSISEGLCLIAQDFGEEELVWCHSDYKDSLNKEELAVLFHHNKLMLSYSPDNFNYFDDRIGYVDTSLFVRINKKVTFSTWQISSAVGMIHTSILRAIKNSIPFEKDFDYFLCSLAKLAMPQGLLCYSEPQLLKEKKVVASLKENNFRLFRFVKQHYKLQWIFLLLFNMMIYENKFPILPFLFSFFYRNRTTASIDLRALKVKSSRKVVNLATVDVIIPTIGRKSYLYDVLYDLKKQTHLPKKVIIVEQNPDEGSVSELDYLTNEKWPFEIQHIFTHQAGACNARNLALKQINSEWVFFADDDIRFDIDLISKSLGQLNKYGARAASLRCFQKGQKQSFTTVFHWIAFGSGCSFVSSAILKDCEFKMGYEFGFGEDGDFGMQLRNKGCDVLYLPEPEILHLKAPIGGFRTKPVQQWHNDSIQPKPSPTVMLYQILHNSSAQIKSYKTTLFLKYYRLQNIKNPIKYYFNFQKQWKRSVFWANELNK